MLGERDFAGSEDEEFPVNNAPPRDDDPQIGFDGSDGLGVGLLATGGLAAMFPKRDGLVSEDEEGFVLKRAPRFLLPVGPPKRDCDGSVGVGLVSLFLSWFNISQFSIKYI